MPQFLHVKHCLEISLAEKYEEKNEDTESLEFYTTLCNPDLAVTLKKCICSYLNVQVCSSEAGCLNLPCSVEFVFKLRLVAMRNKLSICNLGKLEYYTLQESGIFYVLFQKFNHELDRKIVV